MVPEALQAQTCAKPFESPNERWDRRCERVTPSPIQTSVFYWGSGALPRTALNQVNVNLGDNEGLWSALGRLPPRTAEDDWAKFM